MGQSIEDNQNVQEKVEMEQKNIENDNKEIARINPDLSAKNNKSQIPFETFQTFIRPYFEDLPFETYQKIIMPPIFNIEEINTNLFNLKCDNLADMDMDLDELLVGAILSDDDEDFELENFQSPDVKQDISQTVSEKKKHSVDYLVKNIDESDISEEKDDESNADAEDSNEKTNILHNLHEDIARESPSILNDKSIIYDKERQETDSITKYENDISPNRNINEDRIPAEFFQEYKKFIDQIELKNLNMDQSPLVDLSKKQIEINNSRREKLGEILPIKIRHIAVLKTLREIDKKIEKHVFKRIKQKKKKKGEENPDFISKLIGERNIFTETYKQEIENALEVLSIRENLFESDNVDVSHLGLDKSNMFP